VLPSLLTVLPEVVFAGSCGSRVVVVVATGNVAVGLDGDVDPEPVKNARSSLQHIRSMLSTAKTGCNLQLHAMNGCVAMIFFLSMWRNEITK
jgi:hypothetical protein